ncbi:MAG: restriction endonuclease subunit S [Eubacteriales bacterium]
MGEWKKTTIDSLCDLLNGDRGQNYPTADDLTIDGCPFINAGHLINGKVDFTKCDYITEKKLRLLRGVKLQNNDIIYCLRGTIGKNAMYESSLNGTVASSLVVLRANGILPQYLFQLLNSSLEEKLRNANDNGTAQPNLSADSVAKYSFCIPISEKEQACISEILSTVDNAIDKTRTLIEKYKNTKIGMMQDLLESGDEVFLGDKRYFDINPRTSSLPRCFYYIDLESVISGELLKRDIFEKTNAPSRAQRLLKTNDILFQMVRPYQQNNYFFEQEFDLPSVASTGYAQIRTSQNPKFIYYALHTGKVLRSVIAKCTGSNYPAINSTEIKRVSIIMPSIDEQDRVVEQLSSVDQKIQTESNYLAKLQDIKQGLMQDLLTNTVSVDALL